MQLDVYIERGCGLCERAVAIAREMDEAYPPVAVRVVDVAQATRPAGVFAVPTFVLNGEVTSLGNPDESELRAAIESMLGQGPRPKM